MPRARPRRRRRILGLAILIAILVWLGIRVGPGLGLVDRSRGDAELGQRPDDSGPDRERRAALAGAARVGASAPAASADRAPDAAPPPAIDAERSSSSHGRAPTTPAETPHGGPDVAVADRLWGNLRAIDAGPVADAFAAVDSAARLDLDQEQRARLEAAVARLRGRTGELVDAALRQIRGGHVLAGVAALRPLFDAVHEAPQGFVSAAFASAGTPAPVGGPAVLAAAPSRWERGLLVRVERADAIVDAEVVDAHGDEITVRIRGPSGDTFPTVRRSAVEPRDAVAAHALDQARAALRAGDRLLAAGFLVRALRCGADAVAADAIGAALSAR